MSNNFDWIYAGYFKLLNDTVITEITGYFVTNLYGNFDPNSPFIDYRMNIWSMASNQLPTGTVDFTGDEFSSVDYAGNFATSSTGVIMDRVPGPSEIMRLTYTLETPIELVAGEYWFSHDAVITPEPASMLVWAGLGLCVVGGRRLRKRRKALLAA